MTTKTILAAALAAIALAAAPAGAAGERFSYKGRLARADGAAFSTAVAMPMSFRLYDVAAGGQALWGRDIAVRMEADGSFYVELSDADGSPISGAPFTQLESALASGTNFWIGLMPQGYSELMPRQPLATVPRALSAAAAHGIGTVRAKKGVSAGALDVSSAPTVASLSAPGSFAQGSGSTTLKVAADAERAVAAAGETKVTHAIVGVGMHTFADEPVPARAATDTFAVWRDPEGLAPGFYSLVIPRGALLRTLSADASSFYTTLGTGN